MKVKLAKDVQERMLLCLSRARRREVGGVLMAEQLKPGEFRVVDFSLDEITGSAAHFVRSPEHHCEALDDFFARTGNDYTRYNYLGEWHSHPNHQPIPSATDIVSMNNLLEEEESISFAVLLIVKKGWWKRLHCSAVLFRRGEPISNVEVTAEVLGEKIAASR